MNDPGRKTVEFWSGPGGGWPRGSAVGGLVCLLVLVADVTGADRLARTELLLYRTERDGIRTAQTPAEWERRRAEIVRGMEQVMGSFPAGKPRGEVAYRVEEEVDTGAFVRQLIAYDSEPGSAVPAYLAVPKAARSGKHLPAVLCLHPTDNQVGHKVVMGLGGKPNRQYAKELAERGYVTIAPAYPLLANYRPDWRALGYRSGTMKAVWDNVRALDLLSSLPFVDTNAIGAIGHSLGGHNAVFTAVLDPRIRVVVSSCGLDSFLDYKDGDIRGWTSDRYMPELLDYRERLEEIPFDFQELIGALAPRHCLLIAPLHDSNFKWESVDRVAAAARQVYRLYGREARLEVAHPNCEHDFPDEMREKAYRLFDRVLREGEGVIGDQ